MSEKKIRTLSRALREGCITKECYDHLYSLVSTSTTIATVDWPKIHSETKNTPAFDKWAAFEYATARDHLDRCVKMFAGPGHDPVVDDAINIAKENIQKFKERWITP